MRRLYLCPTLLHLFNCIVLEHSFEDHENADLWLSDATDFSEKVAPLQESGLFHRVHLLTINEKLEALKSIDEKEEKREIMRHPMAYFTQVAELIADEDLVYDELYSNQDSYLAKAIYYCLVERGMRPVVHFVNEGTASYAIDLSNTANDWLPHDYYGDARIEKNIKQLWLYLPELYSGGVSRLELKALPYSVIDNEDLRHLLRKVYGNIPSFEQKVVYFEGTFMGDGILTNEMQIISFIADKIGKENIIIKRHPRNTIDRFSPMGYAVMENSSVPWEIMLMDMDVSQKLLISVASFTCLSPMEMYSKKTNAILLEPLLLGRVYFLQSKGYKKFFNSAIAHFNEQEQMIWRPENYEELENVLEYLDVVKY